MMVNSAIEIRKPSIMRLIDALGCHLNRKQKALIYERVKRDFKNELPTHVQYQIDKFTVEAHQKKLGEMK